MSQNIHSSRVVVTKWDAMAPRVTLLSCFSGVREISIPYFAITESC